VLRIFADLTKFGIVLFSILAGLIGYAAGYQSEVHFDLHHFLNFLLGLYFLSSGSLALNQAQEWKLDQKMNRTSKRPVAAGKLTPSAAGLLALFFLVAGAQLLFSASLLAGALGLISVFLYNGAYTLYWKRQWAFAAVPGAIPGALPVTIGYAAINSHIFSPESVYLFLIMFLWQMPHFWVLTIKYKEDYAQGGVPVLPVARGVSVTLYHIVVYTLAYIGVAFAAPLFFQVSWMYVLFFAPISVKLLLDLRRYYRSNAEQKWLSFFMWINISLFVFLAVPVIDKWNFLFTRSN